MYSDNALVLKVEADIIEWCKPCVINIERSNGR